MGSLRLVLGDQLTRQVAALADADPETDVVVMAEVREEATYVRHHRKKIAFVFAAMRHFAASLEQEGFIVAYTRIGDDGNGGSLFSEIERALEHHDADRLVCTACGEFRLDQEMRRWSERLGLPVEIREDDRFVCSLDWFRDWLAQRKQPRMEYFYREMRRRTGLLMTENGEPEGGQWNFDKDNRDSLPDDVFPPDAWQTRPDAVTERVLDDVEAHFGDHFGDLRPFGWGVTRRDALSALDSFIKGRLPRFGQYQDAMACGEETLFHSVLSPYLNAGLLGPLEMCERAERAWRRGEAPLNAVEGFIRQIIGWREYVRGIYWAFMPDYAERNALNARRDLPDFYWTGDTDMRCMAEVIGQTRRSAYAHHIQRLMVTGNFALLAGIDPAQVNEWYLIVYADAYEWVEMPNVSGMALYADGGLMASKPYAASGKYIDRMSDYCRNCRYDVGDATGERACPFNYLYWNFMIEHEDSLRGNRRMGPILGNLRRMKGERIEAMRDRANSFLEGLA